MPKTFILKLAGLLKTMEINRWTAVALVLVVAFLIAARVLLNLTANEITVVATAAVTIVGLLEKAVRKRATPPPALFVLLFAWTIAACASAKPLLAEEAYDKKSQDCVKKHAREKEIRACFDDVDREFHVAADGGAR